MIDHVSLTVHDLEKSRDFYKQVLPSVGYNLIYDIEEVAKWGVKGCSFGEGKDTRLWLSGDGSVAKTHIAFAARSKDEVEAFYKAGLAAGGRDNGAPGPRENYGPNYYAAFVFDPDDNNVEVVYRGQ